MAVHGVQQPNELILYNADGDPYFVRYSYAFSGIGSASTPAAPGEIITRARAATTGVALPAADDEPSGISLPQSRVAVRRYSRNTQQARIIVEWGNRYGGSGGPTPTLVTRSSSVGGVQYDQPFALGFTGGDGDESNPYGSRQIERVRTRVQQRNLITSTGSTVFEIDSAIENNVGKLFNYNGVNRILVGGGFSPISAVQGYVSTVFDRLSPVPGYAAGEIVDFTDPATGIAVQNLAVSALAANQIYKSPTPTAGTAAEPINETYEIGSIADLFWLEG